MRRSPEMIIAVYGVLKAGAAYVPLDAASPQVRLAFMIEDAHTQMLLTQSSLIERLPKATKDIDSPEILCLDTNWETIAKENVVNPSHGAEPEDLAYIIFTSGSTGKPKGTMIRHRNLVNYIWWAKKHFLSGEKLDFPLYSSFAFDLTVTSIFLPLISGGKIAVYSENDSAGDLSILSVIEE